MSNPKAREIIVKDENNFFAEPKNLENVISQIGDRLTKTKDIIEELLNSKYITTLWKGKFIPNDIFIYNNPSISNENYLDFFDTYIDINLKGDNSVLIKSSSIGILNNIYLQWKYSQVNEEQLQFKIFLNKIDENNYLKLDLFYTETDTKWNIITYQCKNGNVEEIWRMNMSFDNSTIYRLYFSNNKTNIYFKLLFNDVIIEKVEDILDIETSGNSEIIIETLNTPSNLQKISLYECGFGGVIY